MNQIETLATDVTEAVNAALLDGIEPKDVLNVLAGALVAMGRKMGADRADIFSLFIGYARVFRPYVSDEDTIGTIYHRAVETYGRPAPMNESRL
jgi:hypothetical protein